MATLQSNTTPNLQISPQKPDAPVQINQRYQNRTYQPYVFQPNFLKQQIRQREVEKALQLGENAGTIQLTLRSNITGNPMTLPQHVVEEMMNRKKTGRKVIDWTPACTLYLERRRWQRAFEDVPSLLPDPCFSVEMQAVMAYRDSTASSVATKFVRSATNKMKCPVYKVVWTPDGRRLVTGSASGEFTLWNGTAFNFETILQAHDSPVRAMSWSRNDAWLITGDNQGYIKYWQLNMNNVKMYQAHKDQACRSVCFGPTDAKFVTASDDGTVRVWDFLRCAEEQILRGHGADVKQVDWHPQKCIVASASKDLHTPVKLWDPRAGQSLATIHAHKGTVMDIKFNRNGNWFLTASRDHLIKLFDIRNLKEERQIFRGHKKEAFSVAWHPVHEDMFASGGSEGNIMYWQVGEEKEIGLLEGAHDSLIWSLAWHPLGHILVSGSNDHSTKFWTRNRPGDPMRDRYNLGAGGDDAIASKTGSAANTSQAEVTNIPGMGDTDAAVADVAKREEEQQKSGIPGLDWSFEEKNEFERKIMTQIDNRKKIPYARPVPRSFAAAWESNKEGAPRRSPSPRRFDEPLPPPPPWHRDEINTQRHHNRPPDMDISPPDNIHILDDHSNPSSRPPGERIPPFEPPPPPPSDIVVYPDGPDISMSEGPDLQNNAHRPGERPPEFMGPGGSLPPPERKNWGAPASNDQVTEEDLLRQAEELYGSDYAELLAMDNLDEALLANYEREASVMNEPETAMKPLLRRGGPGPMRSRGGPGRGGPTRGVPARGVPLRGGLVRGAPGRGVPLHRGRGRIKPLMSRNFDERGRGPGRRMRRPIRRGMYD